MKTWLNKHNILYKTKGKNVTRGWINIQCPFCHDHSNHLGLSSTGGFSCWSCGKKGNIAEIIKIFERCSWKQAKEIAKKLTGFEPRGHKEKKDIIWPKNMIEQPLQLHKKYLKSRGFNVYRLMEEHKIKFTSHVGQDRFSIVAPIGDSYILADCTRNSRSKYTVGPNAENYIYGIENCNSDKAILTEGIIDTWNIGKDCIGAIGNKLTHPQKLALINFDFLIILFDSDAEDKAINLSYQLEGIVENEIYIVDKTKFPGKGKKDPGDMKKEQIQQLRKELLS